MYKDNDTLNLSVIYCSSKDCPEEATFDDRLSDTEAIVYMLDDLPINRVYLFSEEGTMVKDFPEDEPFNSLVGWITYRLEEDEPLD